MQRSPPGNMDSPVVENKLNGDQQKAPQPVCPYCNTDPLVIHIQTIKIGPFTMASIFCAMCRKSLNFNVLNVDQPIVQVPERVKILPVRN